MKAHEIALQLYGLEETPGKESNPQVDRFFRELGFDLDDSYAWCSAFMNYCQKQAGNDYTKSLAAKSWLKWGKATEQPQLGDVVVFHRGDPNSWKGHVGFYINENEDSVFTLGGNQSNKVVISEYAKTRLAGYRTCR